MAKIPVGVRLDKDLVERLRNAIWHTGRGRTVTSMLEEALVRSVGALELGNGGKPFPARKSPIAKSKATR